MMRPSRLLLFFCALATALSAMTPDEVFEDIKANASPDELYRFSFALPKGGDIHHHFGGSVPMEYVIDYYTDKERNGGQDFYVRTKIELCEGDMVPGIPGSSGTIYHRSKDVPSGGCVRPRVLFHCMRDVDWAALKPCCQSQFKKVSDLSEREKEAWLSGLKLDEAGEGRDEFFEKTWWRLGPCFNDITIGPELLVENMKAFGREGVRYMEIQTIPFTATNSKGELVGEEVWYETYKKRLQQPDALATGVTVRFQVVVIRFLPNAEDAVRRAFAFVDSHRDLFVGINMAGREDNTKGQAARFIDVYREMHRKYPKVHLAIHAGESDEPNTNIRDTLLLGADRIGHGFNILDDPDTYLLMRGHQTLIEVNLVSNKLLEYTKDYSDHHFPVSLRTGIPVCLNTDDRGMWDSNMTDEHFVAIQEFNLSWEELISLAEMSLEHAFVEPVEKQRMLAEYKAEIETFAKTYLTADWKTKIAQIEPDVSRYGHITFGLSLPVTQGQPLP
ncbi:MAG: adenosine deaminase family protein [Opitutales bacterium]